jgi:NTE family protein
MRVNAVFEGGGVKGIGLVGAICAAEKRGIEFHQMAGTSVGAIVAALLAAGYSGEEMREILLVTPFKQFIRRSLLQWVPLIGPTVSLLWKKGLYSGDPLENWIADLLAKKGVYTFADLPEHGLRVVASDITQGKMLVLPEDLSDYGIEPKHFPVARAVRMSCSLPFFFEPFTLKVRDRSKGKIRNAVFTRSFFIVDGAILSNYPLWIFDRDMKEWPQKIPTLGFQLVGRKEPEPHNIRGPITMLYALFSTMSAAHDLRYIEQHSRFRTVKILSDMVHTTDFNLNEEKLTELFESGLKAGDAFFSKWTYSGYSQELDQWIDHIQPGLKKKTDSPLSGPPAFKA